MNPLDPNTLAQIAAMVCDTEGPNHRQYWQMERFFDHAGWSGVLPYDNSGRDRWTRELLLSRRDEPEAILQVICRLADPREYPNDPDNAHAVAEQLNNVLAFEGLHVSYVRGRPVVEERDPVFRTPATTAPLSLLGDLSEIVQDEALARKLRNRLDEAKTCRDYGAHLSAVIMLGSVLEGALYSVANQRKAEAFRCRAARLDREGKPLPLSQWHLETLIIVAHMCGWIEHDVREFSQGLRKYRNMVHPVEELKIDHHPNEGTTAICWNVVIAALNDLARLSASGTQR
jgi:hypothetical protein